MPDFGDVIEPCVAQFGRDVGYQVLLRRVRIALGHRRSPSSLKPHTILEVDDPLGSADRGSSICAGNCSPLGSRSHVHATVDAPGLAGDVRRRVRGEEVDDPCDLLGVSGAPTGIWLVSFAITISGMS